MGIMEDLMQGLIDLQKRYKAGTISPEDMRNHLAIHAVSYKTASELVKIYALGVTNKRAGKKFLRELEDKNIITSGASILGVEPDMERLKCPDMDDKIITRGECLDRAGSNSECSSCVNKKITYERLLPLAEQ